MKAIIVGGGIGGLATALALQRIGWEVEVLEQAAAIEEVGAGLQISPNGVKILKALGVWPRIEATLFEPRAIEMHAGASGTRIFSIPVREISRQRWGAPYINIHRADLVDAMKDTLVELSPGAIRLDARVTGYVRDGAGAAAILADGDRVAGDLVVGADGIHSAIRRQMHGADRPRFTGNVAWRAVVPVDRLGAHPPPPTARVWTGRDKHAVTTRIRAGTLANFVGIVEQSHWREEGWHFPGRREEALADFGDWNPVLRTILEECDSLYRWGLFGRSPLAHWSDGPVMLVGDACHPMLPSFAQGAVQALEDAQVLAGKLADGRDIDAACRAAFDARIARATRVQRASARNARVYHGKGPAGPLTLPVLGLSGRLAPGVLLRQLDWLYGHEV